MCQSKSFIANPITIKTILCHSFIPYVYFTLVKMGDIIIGYITWFVWPAKVARNSVPLMLMLNRCIGNHGRVLLLVKLTLLIVDFSKSNLFQWDFVSLKLATQLTMLLTKLSAWTACYSNNCLSSFATLVSYLTKSNGLVNLLMTKQVTYNNL